MRKTRIKKQYKHGLKFDSKLELYFYELLEAKKIKFDFQVTYTLHPSFRYNKATVRAMTLTVDFDFTKHGRNIIVDTKGYQREDNKLKWKFFKYIHKEKQPEIFFPKNQKECEKVVNIVLSL
jgi:hypothetical protein